METSRFRDQWMETGIFRNQGVETGRFKDQGIAFTPSKNLSKLKHQLESGSKYSNQS